MDVVGSRRLVAVLLVFALTGSALAVTQQRLYRSEDAAEASGVEAVQQHSVFVEIVVQREENRTEIHEFAAVVGLIKECKRVRNAFDSAVLWFNDQFLFGAKNRSVRNVTPPDALGRNPVNNSLIREDNSTGRWGGCAIPDGFAVAIGADDPYGVGRRNAPDPETNESVPRPDRRAEENLTRPDNKDLVKRLIALDNRCGGCVFEYQSSFFVTDPNTPNSPQSVRWLVDKLVYPVSIAGNLFQEGRDNRFRGDGCASGNGTLPFSDPRDEYPHQDRCRDDGGEDDRDNHECTDPDGECEPPENNASEPAENRSRPLRERAGGEPNATDNRTLMEPLYSVHLQVDPLASGPRGFLDKAPWEYRDGSGPVQGMPYPQDDDQAAFEPCKTEFDESFECSIEYNFLLAVDFEAFDDAQAPSGEDEIREGAIRHGRGRLPQPKAWQGNSHPHNPQERDAGPNHRHDAVNLDIFFNERAPAFVMEHPYWDEHGGPPEPNEDCSDVADPGDVNETRREAVQARSPIVCDVDQDTGEFHAHDGSETVRPR